jgi:hypothetical protein
MWLTQHPADFAALMIDFCIVSVVGVHSYRDGYLLASPAASWAFRIATGESTHDICVVIFGATFAVVLLVKRKDKVVLAKEVGHLIIEGWVHG